VSLGGDLVAWQAGKYVVLPGHAARLPRLVLGRPGQGKSVYLAREAFLAGLAGRQAIILDGKGDSESLFRILLSDVGHRPRPARATARPW
jgi:hypothetical protein